MVKQWCTHKHFTHKQAKHILKNVWTITLCTLLSKKLWVDWINVWVGCMKKWMCGWLVEQRCYENCCWDGRANGGGKGWKFDWGAQWMLKTCWTSIEWDWNVYIAVSDVWLAWIFPSDLNRLPPWSGPDWIQSVVVPKLATSATTSVCLCVTLSPHICIISCMAVSWLKMSEVDVWSQILSPVFLPQTLRFGELIKTKSSACTHKEIWAESINGEVGKLTGQNELMTRKVWVKLESRVQWGNVWLMIEKGVCGVEVWPGNLEDRNNRWGRLGRKWHELHWSENQYPNMKQLPWQCLTPSPCSTWQLVWWAMTLTCLIVW